MIHPLPRFVLLAIFAGTASWSPVLAINPDDQPRMRNAIAHLEAAKNAEQPVASLRAARKALLNAKPNKEGERIEALGDIKEAIAYATTGDKTNMLDRINKALGKIKSGIARSR